MFTSQQVHILSALSDFENKVTAMGHGNNLLCLDMQAADHAAAVRTICGMSSLSLETLNSKPVRV